MIWARLFAAAKSLLALPTQEVVTRTPLGRALVVHHACECMHGLQADDQISHRQNESPLQITRFELSFIRTADAPLLDS